MTARVAPRKRCASVAAQTGEQCRRPAAPDSIVCTIHQGITSAQKKALKKGLKKRKDNLKKGGMSAHERWGMLLSGTLSVKDLDDDEIQKMRVRGKGGQFGGRAPRVPSHLAQAFQKEGIRRATEMFRTAAPRAVKRLLDIAEDMDTKDADAIRALDIVLNRGLGKTPEIITVRDETKFDKVAGEAVGIDRTVADEASAYLASKGTRKDDAQ